MKSIAKMLPTPKLEKPSISKVYVLLATIVIIAIIWFLVTYFNKPKSSKNTTTKNTTTTTTTNNKNLVDDDEKRLKRLKRKCKKYVGNIEDANTGPRMKKDLPGGDIPDDIPIPTGYSESSSLKIPNFSKL